VKRYALVRGLAAQQNCETLDSTQRNFVVIVRPTAKLRRLLPLSVSDEPESDTALGDWYVNRLVVDRRPLLLCVSSRSLLAVLVPARDVRRLPNRLGEIVSQRLARLGVARPLVDAELEAMQVAHVAKTADRSVVGVMVDFAKMLPHTLPLGFSDHVGLMEAEEFLWENPCYAGKTDRDVVFPGRDTPDLLRARWGSV
jgi:Domain of unknown function (DUF6933)